MDDHRIDRSKGKKINTSDISLIRGGQALEDAFRLVARSIERAQFPELEAETCYRELRYARGILGDITAHLLKLHSVIYDVETELGEENRIERETRN